jgi:acyl carrier protein
MLTRNALTCSNQTVAASALVVDPSMRNIPAKDNIDASPTARVVDLVEEILASTTHTRPVSLTMRLTELGVTSIQMVSLMLAVESAFQLTIPQSDITPENFQSIGSIATLVDRLQTRPA